MRHSSDNTNANSGIVNRYTEKEEASRAEVHTAVILDCSKANRRPTHGGARIPRVGVDTSWTSRRSGNNKKYRETKRKKKLTRARTGTAAAGLPCPPGESPPGTCSETFSPSQPASTQSIFALSRKGQQQKRRRQQQQQSSRRRGRERVRNSRFTADRQTHYADHRTLLHHMCTASRKHRETKIKINKSALLKDASPIRQTIVGRAKGARQRACRKTTRCTPTNFQSAVTPQRV